MIKSFTFLVFFIFGSLLAAGQSWEWAKQGLGASGEGMAVATDKTGNSFLTGNFYDTLHFGSNTISTPSGDVFLVKYDASGNALWAVQSTAGYGAFPYSLATDDSGNVYMTGTILSHITFDTITLNGAGIFMVKYDGNGAVKWAKRQNFTRGLSVSVDAEGFPYFAGDLYLLKYSPNGTLLFALNFSTNAECFGISATPGKRTASAEYITGYFKGSAIFGSDTLVCNSSTDNIFLVKYDSAGNELWARQSETPGFMYSYITNGGWCAVAADINGNAYITGFYNSSISFGADTLPSGYNLYQPNMYVAKYDANGNVKWASSISSTDSSVVGGYAIAADTNNGIYFSGSCTPNHTNKTSVTYRSDTFSIINPGDAAIFMECDSSGAALCGGLLRSGGDDNSSVACDLTGKYIYFGGDAEFQTILGTDTVGFGADSVELPFVARWQNCSGDIISGINKAKNKEGINVYPNPFDAFTTIALSKGGEYILEVDDLTGRTIKYIEFTGTEYELTEQGLAKGIYFIRVFDNEKNIIGVSKVVVQ